MLKRQADFREVCGQQVVLFEFPRDRINQLIGGRFIRTEDGDELTVPVERRPECGEFGDRRLGESSIHGIDESSAGAKAVLNAVDDSAVIRRKDILAG